MQYRLNAWKNCLAREASGTLKESIAGIQVPDLRTGGSLKIDLGNDRAGFYHVQTLDELLGNVEVILSLKNREERVSQEEAKRVVRGMRTSDPYETVDNRVSGVYNLIRKRLEKSNPREANELIVEFLLKQLDFGENCGARLFVNSNDFLQRFQEILSGDENFRGYKLGKINLEENMVAFMMDSPLITVDPFTTGHASFRSYKDEPSNHIIVSYHGAAIPCASFIKDLRKVIDKEKIPARFARLKSDLVDMPWLRGIFYDPNLNAT